MRRRSKQARAGRQSAASRNNRSLAAEAQRSTIPQRHTPPTGTPNDRRRAEPADRAKRA